MAIFLTLTDSATKSRVRVNMSLAEAYEATSTGGSIIFYRSNGDELAHRFVLEPPEQIDDMLDLRGAHVESAPVQGAA